MPEWRDRLGRENALTNSGGTGRRMNRRLLLVIVTALMIASAASFVVYRLTAGRSSPRMPVMTRVVVAARDLQTGTLIRDFDLQIVEWPAAAPKGAISLTAKAVNRGVVSTIFQGEPVTENRLAPLGSGGGLAATIPAGMRACAVRVNDVVGLAGFVLPGMRVDVLITGTPPGEPGGGGPSVRTLLQNIEVLSAGTNIGKDKEGKPQQVQVVNLLVNPHEAEILSLAGNEMHIQLVLRNPSDTGITQPPGSTIADLLGAPGASSARVLKAPPAAPLPEAARPVLSPEPGAFQTIEVINGARHSEARFAAGEQNSEGQ
jgi:pilus assembly protein CpaB